MPQNFCSGAYLAEENIPGLVLYKGGFKFSAEVPSSDPRENETEYYQLKNIDPVRGLIVLEEIKPEDVNKSSAPEISPLTTSENQTYLNTLFTSQLGLLMSGFLLSLAFISLGLWIFRKFLRSS